jgi:secreted PhoX family phosphatase
VTKQLLCAALCAAATGTASAADFGHAVETLAKVAAPLLFGTHGTLDKSSTKSLTADEANANPARLVTVASGLHVSVVSAHPALGPNIDMRVLWPKDHPTHLIACNEQGAAQVGVQRISLATGVPETIIASGLTSCDPVRATPWGTITVGEENGANGRTFEILDPLATTGVTVSGSGATTTTSDPTHVAYRPALGQLAFEGTAFLPNGVMYSTDENRPGNGNPGGAIFKFVPATLWTGTASIVNLDQSPLVAGSLYGLRVGRRSSNTDYGQGNEFGRGTWVPVTGTAPINLRAAGATLKLTSYYRPEDMDLDQKALAAGNVRFCGNNTGDDTAGGDNHFGEIYCVTDGTVEEAAAGTSVPEYQPLMIGNLEFAMIDNIAYQPGRGNWLIHEDGEGSTYTPARNNDIWDCLDDGDDEDNLADACVRVMTLNDLTAESTGGIFDAAGKAYYFSVQHNITGHGVVVKVTGWR